MRITFPNPLGPPITFDTTSLPPLPQFRKPNTTSPLSSLRRPQTRLLLFGLVLFIVIVIRPSPPFPPSFGEEWKVESGAALGDSEGRLGRYVKFDVPQGTGFNHQLQRVLLQHHLALLGNRSLAFEPFVEDKTNLPFDIFRWPWRSARIPLSAYIAGVISGFEKFYNSPRAVPASYYRQYCSSWREHVYTLRTDSHPNGDLTLVPNGQDRIHQIQVLLAGSDESCIRIRGEVFDDAFFDSSAPLELYDSFVRSPVMKHFTFSPTVLGILNRAMPELATDHTPYDLDLIAHPTSDVMERTSSWKHVLALHLRKGKEWEHTCVQKGETSAPFVSFNKLPRLPGNENVPPPSSMVEATRMGLYRAKCLPEVLDIIGRARRMRKNHPLLRVVYILSDGEDEWAEEVRMWLASEGWDKVWIGKLDVYPSRKEREVGVAVDMEIARRAGVFVGNGVSICLVL
ncbi:hypothetical protein M231_07144 [Tremella mesenterica]|uniref:Uncharacterized protein n=1 Tax=Tremella mesenterica TaxID=5217 RepID=A0A4Q1BCY5_TREME|nr:hypothetical protein M231_07144 [Tremella mesenterica]